MRDLPDHSQTSDAPPERSGALRSAMTRVGFFQEAHGSAWKKGRMTTQRLVVVDTPSKPHPDKASISSTVTPPWANTLVNHILTKGLTRSSAAESSPPALGRSKEGATPVRHGPERSIHNLHRGDIHDRRRNFSTATSYPASLAC